MAFFEIIIHQISLLQAGKLSDNKMITILSVLNQYWVTNSGLNKISKTIYGHKSLYIEPFCIFFSYEPA